MFLSLRSADLKLIKSRFKLSKSNLAHCSDVVFWTAILGPETEFPVKEIIFTVKRIPAKLRYRERLPSAQIVGTSII